MPAPTPSRSAMFADLVARHPGNELFRFSLAQALEAEQRHEEAIKHYRLCLEQKPDWMMACILLGKLHLRLGQKAEARSVLETALGLAVAQEHETPEQELRQILADLA